MSLDVKPLISISEIVSAHKTGGDTHEIVATAEATYDHTKSLLIVDLDSFLKKVDSKSHAEVLSQDWLPGKAIVKEFAPSHEAIPAAKEVFQAWVKTVRQTIPELFLA